MSKTTSKSRFSRLLPKFLRGDKSNKTEGSIDSKTPFCFIHFLDDSHHQIQIKGNWKGSLLQEKVCELLSLHEKDYFGLRFIDTAGQTHWLDGNKSLSSQFKGCQTPHKLYFGVKFYAADPCKLREEITRYLFFLQVKQDILQGRLPVTFDEAAELCAYAVQSELGDFDPHQNTAGYVSEFCFVPNQTEELERRIAAIHRRLGGMVPMMAEYRYLDKVKWLDMYGVDLHPVMGEGNVEYFLGLTPTGIVVYKNKNKVGNYFWPRINKVTFKGKIFIVKVKDKNNEEHAYAFELPRKTACKHLWKCCVEHHAFFSGRSERQAVSDNLSRHPSNVVRLPSRRQPRRINSDSKLNSPENYESQYDHDTGMVTMLMRPEPVRAPRHHSLPELQGHESPRSTKSAPWETNFDYGLYTHGKDSPVSERSNKMREQRNRAMTGSDSESGISQRRKYFPNRRGSDNDSDVSVTRRRRRDIDSDSASDISSRYPASHSHKSAFPVLYPFHDKENRPNGSIPSLHSAPAGESKQRRRRRRSKSPGKRPPEELKQHFEYGLKDTEGLSTEELKEIPFVNIETKASLFKLKYSPKLRQKVKAAKQKSLGDLDQNRNQVMKRQTSAPLDDEMDRAASVHSQPISRKDPEDRDSTSYTQSGVGNSRVPQRPHSYHQLQPRNVRSDSNTLPHSSIQPPLEPSSHRYQNSNSDAIADSHAKANSGVTDSYSQVPSERSYRVLQSTDPSHPPSRLPWDGFAPPPQSSKSPHDNYAEPQSVRSPYDAKPESSRSPYSVSAAPQHSRSPHDNYSVPQSSRPSHENSKPYHPDYEAPRSRSAASNSSYRSHRSHHRDNVSHAHPAHPRSQGPYDSDNNNNTARRRKDRRQDQNSDTARNNSYRNSGRQSRGHLQEQDQSEQDGRMEAEYERLQQQPVPDSRMDGSASRPGQVRDESQQVAESYSGYQYRDGSSEQTHYMAPPPASQGAPPPYQVHQSSNVSYSSFTSPPQNYYHHHHHHQQQPPQQPPRRPASTLSPYANPPSQNYHNSGRVSPYNSVAPHGHYDQGQRPRSYGQDDDGRSKLYHDEGHKLREREGDWSRGYSQEKGQRSRYRDDSDRPRSSFHEEHLARPPRPPYQGEPQRNQHDHRSPSGYQHNTSNYQPPPRQYQQQSPQSQYQGAPARHQGTPPRHQGTPPRQQGTPPRQQGTPPRQPVFSTPPRQSMDPRYSQGLVSMHAREQSEGSSSQASVLGGGNYHRSPRPSPAHSGSDRSGSRNLGNSLTSEQTRQLLRSPNYNPDLCTEL